MEFMIVLFVILVMAFIIRGFWTTSRLSGKIFQVVERELDRQITNVHKPKQACAHCGSMMTETDKCPNCGASVVP